MTAALAIVLVLVVAVFVVSPLMQQADVALAEAEPGSGELWSREKAVAILAITEADFDLATGKLSDDDYRILRSDYEGRALQAMDEIERQAAPASAILRGMRRAFRSRRSVLRRLRSPAKPVLRGGGRSRAPDARSAGAMVMRKPLL
jgi:hypothetical protein